MLVFLSLVFSAYKDFSAYKVVSAYKDVSASVRADCRRDESIFVDSGFVDSG
jgi:hypothetical protein